MFDPQSYNENLFFGQTFTHPIRSHHIQRNMKRSGAWETWRRRAGKIVYQKIKRNESITLQSKSLLYTPYNWKIDGGRLHIFEKSSFLDLEPSAMIQNSCHFSPLLILQNCVEVWLSLAKSISEFSTVYKKWVLWYVLGSIITILTCN